ncbi:MAG: hypothetical protein AAF249_10970 [Pseudomonadota bacterium]
MSETYAHMIDYLALSIGHGLLAVAFFRLVLRDGLDLDPLLAAFKRREAERREARRSKRAPKRRG